MGNYFELLSPAGGKDEFFAAINSGADAVYTGLQSYSARKNAKNLSLSDLKECVSYAHLIGKKVYVTLNIMMFDEEIQDLISFLPSVFDIGPDGIIIQDIGVFNLLKKHSSGIELHASTQMTADNFYGVKNLSDFGFDRVVVAREMSIEEIKDIKNSIDVSIEGFVHGALCVCYSGECYFSSAIGERSANRGDCAQPCRKRYNLFSNGVSTGKSGFYLSMKDLNTSSDIKDVAKYLDSLKIEGRMKNKDYVSTVTKYYRNKLDGKKVSHKDDVMLADAFSRGFTKGFILSENEEMINSTSPKHIGSLVGKVVSTDKNSSKILLSENLYPNDGIVYLEKNKKANGEKIVRAYNAGSTIAIKRELINGSSVFRNYSQLLSSKTENSSVIKRLPLDIVLHSKIGQNLKVDVSCLFKHINYEVDFKIEESKSMVDSTELLEKSFARLGDTFFYLNHFDLRGDKNIFIPKSILNDARRDIVEKICKEEAEKFFHEGVIKKSERRKRDAPKISLLVNEKLSKKNLSKVDEIRLDFRTKNVLLLLEYYRGLGYEPVLLTPSIITKEGVESLRKFIYDNRIKKIVANNYGVLDFDCDIIVGSSLNCSNSYAIDFYNSLDINEFIPSREMTLEEIKNAFSGTILRLPYYQKTVSMTTKTIGKDVKEEIIKGNFVEIVDLKNESFQVEKLGDLYYIYNSRPLFMAKTLDRIDADIIEITYDKNFDAVLDYLFYGNDVTFKYTTGHYNRGISR